MKVKQYKLSRRLGVPLFEKCQSQSYVISTEKKRARRTRRPRKQSEYGVQLIEKQKARFLYGINEKQFLRYVTEAFKSSTPHKVLEYALERRLDNVVYRSGYASTRRAARQLVVHGHILVNDKKTKSPSFRLSVGDTISIRKESQSLVPFANLKKQITSRALPPWLRVTGDSAIVIEKNPAFMEDPVFQMSRVFEYYSR